MSMAARCPACATVFRVVQDQLRVSEGWVRCGRCAEVFNAIEHLVDLDVDVASLTSTRSPGTERVMHDLASVAAPPHQPRVDAVQRVAGDIADDPVATPAVAVAAAVAAAGPIGASPVHRLVDGARGDGDGLRSADSNGGRDSDSSRNGDRGSGSGSGSGSDPMGRHIEPQRAPVGDATPLPSPSPAPAPAPAVTAGADDAVAAFESAVGSADGAATLDLRAEPRTRQPRFVRMAERAAWWRRPAVRGALALVSGVLVIALSLQVAYAYRDLLAARSPAVKPWLERGCAAVGCTIGPPRAIDGLSVDSSGLVRIEGTPLYRLSVVLRNRTAIQLAVPSIDLTLTDSQGGVVARRVIEVAQLGGNGVAEVAALAELALQTTLGVGDRIVSGYTIELFYP